MNVPPMAMAMPHFAPPAAAAVMPRGPPLPAGWSEHFTPQGARYYYNASTGVSTYDLPTAMATAPTPTPTPTAAAAVPATTSPAVAITWIEYKDDASGLNYYYNAVTKATTWDQPEEFRMQQARVEVAKMKSSTEANGAIQAEEQRKRDSKKQQADDEAIKMFEAMAKDERVAVFKTFLEEKQVSPQFKWQEALRFLSIEGHDKDPRWKFSLSTVGEKKQAFSEYCTQAVNKQNIERRRQAKKSREDFLELLNNIEDRVLQNRVTWDDVDQGAEFYGLRKDARWLALEDSKRKKDLFEGFVQDVLRKKDQIKARKIEEFKDTFMAKLKEKATVDRTFFVGKRRLDGDLKKRVWRLVEELDGPSGIAKHDVYDWTEKFLDILKAEDSESSKAEREKKKRLESEFTSKLHEAMDEWLKTERIGMNTTWKELHDLVHNDVVGNGEFSAVSERHQRRVIDKKMKAERERLQPAVETVTTFLAYTGFIVTESTTFDAFSDALRAGVTKAIEMNKPEEGEEDPHEQPTAVPTGKSPYTVELEASVNSTQWPLFAKHAFYLLQYIAARNKNREARDRSRSPSSSRKRRRSSVESPRRTRSASRHRSRSRSRSRSASRTRQFRSPSQSQDPRAALSVTSYRDLPPSPKHPSFPRAGPPPTVGIGAPSVVVDEAARAEEIIRQARLKLLAKQAAKERGDGQDSEPEEGEEVEDGELEE